MIATYAVICACVVAAGREVHVKESGSQLQANEYDSLLEAVLSLSDESTVYLHAGKHYLQTATIGTFLPGEENRAYTATDYPASWPIIRARNPLRFANGNSDMIHYGASFAITLTSLPCTRTGAATDCVPEGQKATIAVANHWIVFEVLSNFTVTNVEFTGMEMFSKGCGSPVCSSCVFPLDVVSKGKCSPYCTQSLCDSEVCLDPACNQTACKAKCQSIGCTDALLANDKCDPLCNSVWCQFDNHHCECAQPRFDGCSSCCPLTDFVVDACSSNTACQSDLCMYAGHPECNLASPKNVWKCNTNDYNSLFIVSDDFQLDVNSVVGQDLNLLFGNNDMNPVYCPTYTKYQLGKLTGNLRLSVSYICRE